MHETRRMQPLLGTFVEIGAAGTDDNTLAAIDAAFAAIAQLQRQLSFQSPDSELSRLNASAGEWVTLSRHSLRVLRLAVAMMRASGGVFDCTLGGALVTRCVLPDHLPHRRAEMLASGHAGDIEMDRTRVRLRRPVRITLDGIAKGYAVDLAIAALKQHHVDFGWINAGGDLRVFGERVLPVIQRQADGSTRALGGLSSGAMATSHVVSAPDKDLPGFILASDKHATATPPQPGVFSVIARHAWRADALTKVAALSPLSERRQRVAALGGLLIEEVVSCAA